MKNDSKEKEVNDFCKKHNLTTYQFYGKEKIGGYLDLGSVTSLPENFNPTVGGYLDLGSVKSLPENFNPTVGGYLDLGSVKSLPENFNPTVGGNLYLRSVTSLPENFNPTVGGYLDLRSVTSLPENFNPTVGGNLYLRSVTSLPENFNPTVGGYLDLGSVKSLPENFNPTVGGGLYWKNKEKYIGADVPQVELSWQDGKYKKVDGIFCEMTHPHPHTVQGFEIFKLKKVNIDEFIFLAKKDSFYAHGKTIEKAIEDLRFKIVSEKLKKEPINKNTLITRQYYRVITGACGLGVSDWMEKNKITKEEITAEELLPILVKTNAYGVDRFKKLITF
jgi:hypothetical protein